MWKTRWFGEGGWHPDLRMGNHVVTPVGQPCGRCGRPIQEGDEGVILTIYADANAEVEAHAWPGPVHRRCSGLAVAEKNGQG